MASKPSRQSRRTLVPEAPPIEPRYWDANQVAVFYNITPTTARRKARENQWPGAVCLGGVWRFPIPAGAVTKSIAVLVPHIDEPPA